MRIRLLTSIGGPAFSYTAGQEVEFPDDEAARLIASDPPAAEPIGAPAPETTSLEPPERAVLPKAKARKPGPKKE